MIEAEWWDYEGADEWAEAVAGDIGFIVESATDARDAALLALPSDETCAPVLARLAKSKLPWKKVMVVPTDELRVAVSDPRSSVQPRIGGVSGQRDIVILGADRHHPRTDRDQRRRERPH